MLPKVSGIDVSNAIINLEFRLGILEQLVARLAAGGPPNMITDESMRQVRDAVFQKLRAKYPEAGLALSAQDVSGPDRARHVRETVFLTLHSNSVSAGRLDLRLKNAGSAFNVLSFEATTPGCRVVQWYPRSLAEGELLHAPTDLPSGNMIACEYEMRIRDRTGSLRKFQILVDPQTSPTNYDFVEI